MKRSVTIGLIVVSLLAVSYGYAQKAEAVVPDTSSVPEMKEEKQQTNEIAVYGEVGDVSVTANTLTVQYYDYDTDNEKTVTIAVEPNTRFENTPNIGGIKKGDWVDVTYAISGTKNTAVSIVLEQDDESEKALTAETVADDAMSGDVPEEPVEKTGM